MRLILILLVPFAGFILAGCDAKSSSQAPTGSAVTPASDAVSIERAKLSAEDRTLVDAQEWCVISNESRLGSMGPPIKLMIKDKPVFVCCGNCKKKAESDPEKTLAKLDELKAKAKAARP